MLEIMFSFACVSLCLSVCIYVCVQRTGNANSSKIVKVADFKFGLHVRMYSPRLTL